MNPTSARTEATTQAIERYLADNPGNEPLNTLGMTADGRIVRLAEQEEGLRPELHRVFKHQLGALIPQMKHFDDPFGKPVRRERMVERTLKADVQTLGDYRDRIWWDQQIRNRLSTLKAKYATEFSKLDKLTRSHIQTFTKDAETTGPNYRFVNNFTQHLWTFKDNHKTGEAAKAKDFFMSNVIIHQFMLSFDTLELLLELPEVIERNSITNKKTIDTLIQHKKDYRSDDFRTAFLETTDNGKSTVRVARDLGLTIKSISVTYKGQPVDSINDPIDGEDLEQKFCVKVHVSPDKKVYDSP
ncbi:MULTISPECIES: hypothetical protein [unclassified Endozoicomonas]|uniref:hypothetical protein n=1 Tax=unclassified Endozoicomonas TaxID=2644528 RepID=UPI003BB6409C